jgi:hypothetical protein
MASRPTGKVITGTDPYTQSTFVHLEEGEYKLFFGKHSKSQAIDVSVERNAKGDIAVTIDGEYLNRKTEQDYPSELLKLFMTSEAVQLIATLISGGHFDTGVRMRARQLFEEKDPKFLRFLYTKAQAIASLPVFQRSIIEGRVPEIGD